MPDAGHGFSMTQILVALCGVLATLLIGAVTLLVTRGVRNGGRKAGDEPTDFWLRQHDQQIATIRLIHSELIGRLDARMEKLHADLLDRFDTLIKIQRGRAANE